MGKIRIISGIWRGRKLEFPDKNNLRPTPDRIRETLFNWLMHDISGSTCLDLFAGSGALGFEALSRGAEKVFFVEKDADTLQALKMNVEKCATKNAEIIFSDFLKNPPKFQAKIFDLIFLDPPYESDLISKAFYWLVENDLLKDHARIYVETKKSENPLTLPSNFQILKNASTASIFYYLCEYKKPSNSR